MQALDVVLHLLPGPRRDSGPAFVMHLEHQLLRLGLRIPEELLKDVRDVLHEVHRIVPDDRHPGVVGPDVGLGALHLGGRGAHALIVGLNAAVDPEDPDLEDASPMTAAAPALQALDGVLAKARSENFPVALWFLPKQLRADLLAIYGYARFVDDIGDEFSVESTVRLAMLDLVDADVTTMFAGRDASLPAVAALTAGVRAGRVPETPLRRLVEANRLDQHADRYETFDDLRHYCTLSADPVGHLVLAALGLATPDRIELSDKICTALQLAEHWQDVAEDLGRGRVYLPQEDLRRFAVSDDDLRAAQASPAVKTLMAFEVARASDLLGQGAPLVGLVPGRGKLAIAGFVAGGRAALHAITAADFDVLAGPPKPTKQRTLREAAGILTSRAHADG